MVLNNVHEASIVRTLGNTIESLKILFSKCFISINMLDASQILIKNIKVRVVKDSGVY